MATAQRTGFEAAGEVARRLRERYDPEHPDPEIYADELVIWHNYDEVEIKLDREQLAAGARMEHAALSRVLAGLAYEDRKVYAGDGIVVATHVMTGTLPDGNLLRMPACHVYTLVDGRVARSDVYVDSGQMQAIAAAFQAAGVTLSFDADG